MVQTLTRQSIQVSDRYNNFKWTSERRILADQIHGRAKPAGGMKPGGTEVARALD